MNHLLFGKGSGPGSRGTVHVPDGGLCTKDPLMH